jgi:hypothetical protein
MNKVIHSEHEMMLFNPKRELLSRDEIAQVETSLSIESNALSWVALTQLQALLEHQSRD